MDGVAYTKETTMQYLGAFSGNSPVIKRYKASATGYLPGIVMVASVSNASGQMSTSTTTTATDTIGLLLDNGNLQGASITYSTTQGADEAVFGVIVNPDAILRAQMVTGATGTAATAETVTSAASNGLTVTATGAADFTSPQKDEGTVWYTTGANVGKSRKITSTAATVLTVIVPFAANAVGDTFLSSGAGIGLRFVTTTTNLQNIRTDAINTSGAALAVLDLELGGTGDSFIHLTYQDCVWNYTT